MWALEFAARLLGRTPKHSLGFIRSMTLPIMVIVMVLGLINGLAGETELISENVGVSTRLLVLEEGKTDFSQSSLDESIIDVLKHPKIRQVLPQRIAHTFLHFADSAISTEVLGANQTAFLEFFGEIITVGLAPTEGEESCALIGSQLAKQLPTLRNSLPATIGVSRETEAGQFNATVTGIVGGDGHYLDDLILPPSLFITLFPEYAEKISFLELELWDTSDSGRTIEALRRQAKAQGHHIQIVLEQSQSQIADHIMNDIIVIFWAFGLFAFFIVSIQTYFAVKWIAIHYRVEFATLRCLGTPNRLVSAILLFSAILLGNIALALALITGILSATALLAIATTFTQTTRFYASVDLSSLLMVAILANISIILGSMRQIREIGKNSLLNLS